MKNRRLKLTGLFFGLLSATALPQALRPAGSPVPPAFWEGGSTVSFVVPFGPKDSPKWPVRAIVIPLSKPIVVQRNWSGGPNDAGTRAYLSFDVRAESGLEPGRIYHCLAPLEGSARPSDATRFLLMGWKAANGGLAVETQDDFLRQLGRPIVSIRGDKDDLFVSAFVPTSATETVGGDWAIYDNLVRALPKATPTTIRQVTTVFAWIPDITVGTPNEQAAVYSQARERLLKVLPGLPQTTPLERFRYGGLMASWDRPNRALAYLKALPALHAAIGLDLKDPLVRYFPSVARDDLYFWGRLSLVEGVDPDAVFEAVWNTPLQDYAIDPQLSRSPSIDNQRRAFSLLGGADTDRKAQIFARLAGWNSDWPRLAQANAHWSDAANGVVIDDEAALQEYWEKKLAIPAKP